MDKCCMCEKPIKDYSEAENNPFFHNWWHIQCRLDDEEKVRKLKKGITVTTNR